MSSISKLPPHSLNASFSAASLPTPLPKSRSASIAETSETPEFSGSCEYPLGDTLTAKGSGSVKTQVASPAEDPKQAPKSVREAFSHGVATGAGWIGAITYGLSLVWLPMLVVATGVGAVNWTVNKVFNLSQEKPMVNGLMITLCFIPAVVGGTLAAAGWIASLPFALVADYVDSKRGARQKRPTLLSSARHAVLQGAYTGARNWPRVLDSRDRERGWEGIPTDVDKFLAQA